MNIKKIFGENLKKYRKEAGLTQEKLSEMVNISAKHLSNIEIGQKFVSADLIEKLYSAINISPSKLFFSSKLNENYDNKIGEINRIIDNTAKKLKEEIGKF